MKINTSNKHNNNLLRNLEKEENEDIEENQIEFPDPEPLPDNQYEYRNIYIAQYIIENNCVPYSINYENSNLTLNISFPQSLKSNVDLLLINKNKDEILYKTKINSPNYNKFLYTYNFSSKEKGVYGIKIIPHSLYYDNNNIMFYDTLELYNDNLQINNNSKYYYPIYIIHDEENPQSIVFDLNDEVQETDTLKLPFSDICFSNKNLIECYFTDYLKEKYNKVNYNSLLLIVIKKIKKLCSFLQILKLLLKILL